MRDRCESAQYFPHALERKHFLASSTTGLSDPVLAYLQIVNKKKQYERIRITSKHDQVQNHFTRKKTHTFLQLFPLLQTPNLAI